MTVDVFHDSKQTYKDDANQSILHPLRAIFYGRH